MTEGDPRPQETTERGDSDESQGMKAVVNFNKKKYNMIEQEFRTHADRIKISQDQVDLLLNLLRTALNFDPTMPTYSKDKVQKLNDYRKQRALQAGTSEYEISSKPYYSKYRKTKQATSVH